MIVTTAGQVTGTASTSWRHSSNGFVRLLIIKIDETKTDAELAALFAPDTVTDQHGDTYTDYHNTIHLNIKAKDGTKYVWLSYTSEVTRYTETYLEQRNAELEAALTEIQTEVTA